ncbi:MAG: amidohydrolase family protein, partial [Acidobacteria bacterium]|nr:amidohydrolase family protein [Acidobacteriota bacterium]
MKLRAMACLVASVCLAIVLNGASAPPYDLLVRNGLVLDGSGSRGVRADIAVAGGRIAGVGRFKGAEAATVIDAAGLVVAPGFIDVHTHADQIASHPLAENFIRMGVTTVVAGNCGGAGARISETLAAIRAAGITPNFATLVGHNTVREQVMGRDQRPPTADELERMKALVAQGMADGA